MTENNSSGDTPTVNRRDVLRATGAAAAGGALTVGATGSTSAHPDCVEKCVEFTSSESTNGISVTISGDTASVCNNNTDCTVVVYIKVSTEFESFTLEGGECTGDVTTAEGHDISNVTVCPAGDAPGYATNGGNGNGNGNGNR
jgi:anaerobic selenocysteine-containing dehydrogenase